MFDQVSLNRNGWHAKLQKWTFGYVPYENNFCPFFWLTIFCALAAPFVVLYRYILKGAVFLLFGCVVGPFMLFERLFDWLDEKYCKPAFKRKIDVELTKMTDDDIYNFIFRFIFNDHKCFGGDTDIERYKDQHYRASSYKFDNLKKKARERYTVLWDTWKNRAGDDWETRLRAARERWIEAEKKRSEIRRQLEEAKLAAEARRRQFFASLVKYTRLLVILPIGIVTIYTLYWLGRLGIIIVENWSEIMAWFVSVFSAIWGFIIWAAPWTGVIVGGLLVIGITVYSVAKLIIRCNISIPGVQLSKRVFGAAWSPFRSVGSFFAMYFKTLKDNHCPSIEWDK